MGTCATLQSFCAVLPIRITRDVIQKATAQLQRCQDTPPPPLLGTGCFEANGSLKSSSWDKQKASDSLVDRHTTTSVTAWSNLFAEAAGRLSKILPDWYCIFPEIWSNQQVFFSQPNAWNAISESAVAACTHAQWKTRPRLRLTEHYLLKNQQVFI